MISEDLKNKNTLEACFEHLTTFCDFFPKIFEDFRRLSKISENFQKFQKIIGMFILAHFGTFS